MTLYEALGSTQSRISSIAGEDRIIERLYELGFRQGLDVSVIRKLPFGGPFVVQVGRVVVALREEEAQCLTLESINPLR